MADDSFEQLIRKAEKVYELERAKLLKERDRIDVEISALDERWKSATGRKSVAGNNGASRKRVSRRAEILQILKAKPDGLGRAAILEALGVLGDKSAENSVSTALVNMKKKGEIDNKDGLYVAA